MDLGSIISGSDNLFKYLFTAGILMIVTSLVYPLEKQQEIEIEINNYNKEMGLLNAKLLRLQSKVHGLVKQSSATQHNIDSLKILSSGKASAAQLKAIVDKIEMLKAKFNEQYAKLESEQVELETSSIILSYNKSRLKDLERHVQTYGRYYKCLFWLGICATIIGLSLWSFSTYWEQKAQRHEIKQRLKSR